MPVRSLESKSTSQQQRVMAYDKDHNVVAIYPATVGSEDRPSPEASFKVTKITENPVYHYDPSLHLRGVHVQEKLDLPPDLTIPWVSSGSTSPPKGMAFMARQTRTRSARPPRMAASD